MNKRNSKPKSVKKFVRKMRTGRNPSISDQEKTILRAAQRVNSRFQSGALVSIAQVVKAVSYPKHTSKKYIVSLANKGIVALHRHDFPSSLSREERKAMIFSKGNYYIGMALTDDYDRVANPVKRKVNRQDIHKTVRDHIRAGRNQKQILDLMKRAGFKKEHLAEARKIYNSEKQLVKRMRTGRNPKVGKVLSTVKRVAIKAGKTAIGAVKGAIKGGAKAAKGNPRKRVTKKPKKIFTAYQVKEAKKEIKRLSSKRRVSTRKRKRNSPIAEQQRKQFAGHFDGYRDLYYPSTNPPKEPSKLGVLKRILTKKLEIIPHRKNSIWLVRDRDQNLHLGSTDSNGIMWDGVAQDLDAVLLIEYFERKPHLGDYQLTEYYHRMGEENGVRPHLWSDGKGGLVFKGGDYRIESRGIVN